MVNIIESISVPGQEDLDPDETPGGISQAAIEDAQDPADMSEAVKNKILNDPVESPVGRS